MFLLGGIPASGPLAVQTTTWREWRIAAQLQKKSKPALWLENEFLGMLNAKKKRHTYAIGNTYNYIYIHNIL